MKDLQFRNKIMAHGFSPMPKFVLKSPALSMQAKTLYCQLMDYAWYGEAFPGRMRLAEENGCHVSSIDRFMSELKELGLISVTRRGLGLTNLYTIEDFTEDVINNLSKPSNSKESLHIVTQDSLSEVTQESSHIVNKEKEEIKEKDKRKNSIEDMSPTKQQTLISISQTEEKKKVSAKKKLSHLDTALLHIQQAREGEIKWEKVTDRDFTLYYQQKHEEILSQQIAFDRYASIGQFRDWFINKYDIERHQLADFIDMMLVVYRDKDIQSQKHHSLTFNMFTQTRQQDMISRLLRRVKYELDRISVKEETSHTDESEENLSYTDEVF